MLIVSVDAWLYCYLGVEPFIDAHEFGDEGLQVEDNFL